MLTFILYQVMFPEFYVSRKMEVAPVILTLKKMQLRHEEVSNWFAQGYIIMKWQSLRLGMIWMAAIFFFTNSMFDLFHIFTKRIYYQMILSDKTYENCRWVLLQSKYLRLALRVAGKAIVFKFSKDMPC